MIIIQNQGEFLGKGGDFVEQCGDKADKEAKFYLKTIQSAAYRMHRMVKDILDHSKITNKEMFAEEVDLNIVIEDTKASLDELIRRESATIQAEELPKVIGSTIMYDRLFQNLIGNAV